MVSPVVIDASVVAAYLLREPEAGKFDAVLMRVMKGESGLHVPSLFQFELLNILVMAERHKRISALQHNALMSEFEVLPIIDDAPPGFATKGRITALAMQHRLTAYDAAYLELAERLNASLVSMDSDLLRLQKTYPFIY